MGFARIDGNRTFRRSAGRSDDDKLRAVVLRKVAVGGLNGSWSPYDKPGVPRSIEFEFTPGGGILEPEIPVQPLERLVHSVHQRELLRLNSAEDDLAVVRNWEIGLEPLRNHKRLLAQICGLEFHGETVG